MVIGHSFVAVLFALLVVHALCDYPLQGDFMARAKSPAAPVPGVPWVWPMAMHGLIHAGGVWLVTASVACTCIELISHIMSDVAKCCGQLSFSHDQAIHIGFKIGFAGMVTEVFW